MAAIADRRGSGRAAEVGVCATLERVVGEERAAAVVLVCSGRSSVGLEAEADTVEATRVLQAVESAPRPVVLAVEGDALGFGFALALACDLAIATPDAMLGLPEITHGTAPANAIGRAPDVIGRGWTRHLALRGRRWLNGEEAHRLGLIVELHPPETLRSAAVALALEAARNPSFGAAKRILTLDAERTYRLTPSIIPGPSVG